MFKWFSWLYRIRPSVLHEPYRPAMGDYSKFVSDFSDKDKMKVTPNQMRWKPIELPKSEKVNFVEGITTICGAGEPALKVCPSSYLMPNHY